MAKIQGGRLGYVIKATVLHKKPSPLSPFFSEKELVMLINTVLYRNCSAVSFKSLLPSLIFILD